MKNCSFKNCSEKHYARGFCRRHYRCVTKESGKRWKAILQNQILYKRKNISFKKWYKKVKDTNSYKEFQGKKWKKWYSKNRQHFREYLNRWRKSIPLKKLKEYRQKDNATRQFGSWKLRESIIQRDGEKCVRCGITREEHKKRWNQDLHVDHKDNYGRGVIKEAKNNDPDNLETLCIRCHRSKSAKEQWDIKREELLIYGKDFIEELKEKVREKSGRICEFCGKTEKQNKRKLDIHHINGNKKNNRIENLRALCTICHWQIEQRVKSTKTADRV